MVIYLSDREARMFGSTDNQLTTPRQYLKNLFLQLLPSLTDEQKEKFQKNIQPLDDADQPSLIKIYNRLLVLIVRFQIQTPASLEIIKVLVRLGIDVNQSISTYFGKIPLLHYIACFNLTKIAEILIKQKNIDLRKHDELHDYTALDYAMCQKHYRMMSLLSGHPFIFSFFKANTTKKVLGNQTWLMKRVKILGYELKNKGLCNGISIMGGQAILLSDTNLFAQRFAYIKSIPLNEFKDKVNSALQNRAEKNPLTTKEQILVDFSDMCDGLVLNQNQGLNKKYNMIVEALRGKEEVYDKRFSGLMSVKLQEKKGIELIGNKKNVIFDFGKKEEIEQYFLTIKEKLNPADCAFVIPVLLYLPQDSTKHAFTIGYDIEKNNWVFIDANHPKILVICKNEQELVLTFEYACKHLTSSCTALLDLSVLTAKENAAKSKPLIENEWMKSCNRFSASMKRD